MVQFVEYGSNAWQQEDPNDEEREGGGRGSEMSRGEKELESEKEQEVARVYGVRS